MDTGLAGQEFGFSLHFPDTGGQFQAPVTPPGSPDQKILQQTIPPVLEQQRYQPPTQVPTGPSHPGGGITPGPG